MEDMTACQQLLEALHRRVGEQNDALATLGEIFAREAERLRRHDQARCLRDLRSEVMVEVKHSQREEADAAYAFNKVTFIGGLAKFALGTLGAIVVRSDDPLSVGLRLAKSDFERTQPYGTVLVVVGPGGVPDDVDMIPVSRWARELGRSEAQIEAALKAKGNLLMTPQTFSEFMEELEDRVLRGMVALPAATPNLVLKAADGDTE